MDGVRACYDCKVTKPLDEFPNSKAHRLGKFYRCRICSSKAKTEWQKNNTEKHKATVYRWRAKNPRLYRDRKLRALYGLKIGSYERILAAQNGACAICKTTEPGSRGSFHVDHCHETNKVRGLLCISCNTSLGKFKHNPAILRAAIEYLSEPSCGASPSWDAGSRPLGGRRALQAPQASPAHGAAQERAY